MPDLCLLEYVRSHDGVWNLPPREVEALRARLPGIRIVSPADPAEVAAMLPEADIVLGFALRRDNFARASRLRWIHVSAAGVGPLLFPELVESDVLLSNGRGLHAVSMAEHALAVILGFYRKLHLARDAQARAEWTQDALWTGLPEFRDLGGATLGLVGLGSVGRAIASRAHALGMRVIAVRRRPGANTEGVAEQWGESRLDDLLAASDVVVLAAPLTTATRSLIGSAQLARMRPHALLVNLGRGALVDEPALIAALERGALAGAALDVTLEEPLPAASPLWAMKQVILTPHISGLGPRYWERAMDMFVEHVEAFREGRPLPNLVNKREGY
jgi:phosphoglycerate dehydrogenase-like enzyme